MTKILKEAAVTTRAARAKLESGLYWRGVDPDVHLGYRKGRRGGIWLVRWRNGAGYRQAKLGTADDELREGALDFNAAVRSARVAVEAARAEARAVAEGPPLTVRLVVEEYISSRDARDSRRKARQVRSDASQRLCRYVLGQVQRGKQEGTQEAPLAKVALHALCERDVQTWLAGLPETMKATSKQRLVNDLKAALNRAYSAHRDRLPATLPAIIKAGLKAAASEHDEAVPLARENQILTDAQVGKLLAAAREIDAEEEWSGDLFRFVLVLAATGARFSQAARLRVGDVQREQGRLMVPASRKGREAKTGHVPVPVGSDVLDALLPAVTGRAKDAALLERWRHEQVAGSIEWQRSERSPWHAAGELTRPWRLIRTRAKMPDVIPYALRHTSIVRGIRANLPIRLVAALHDTSVIMIERHYGRWIADGLTEMAAAAVMPLVPEDGGNVISIARDK